MDGLHYPNFSCSNNFVNKPTLILTQTLQLLRSNHTHIVLSTCSQVQRYKLLELKEIFFKNRDGLHYPNFSYSINSLQTRKRKKIEKNEVEQFLEVVQNIKTQKKPVLDFEFGIIKDRWIDAYPNLGQPSIYGSFKEVRLGMEIRLGQLIISNVERQGGNDGSKRWCSSLSSSSSFEFPRHPFRFGQNIIER